MIKINHAESNWNQRSLKGSTAYFFYDLRLHSGCDVGGQVVSLGSEKQSLKIGERPWSYICFLDNCNLNLDQFEMKF